MHLHKYHTSGIYPCLDCIYLYIHRYSDIGHICLYIYICLCLYIYIYVSIYGSLHDFFEPYRPTRSSSPLASPSAARQGESHRETQRLLC